MASEATGTGFDFLLEGGAAKVRTDMWFVVVGKAVIAQGTDLQSVIAEAKAKRPGQRLFIGKFPSDHTMLL